MDPASPPLGIPPLLWLLIFLIGGPTTLSLLFSRMAARIPGFAGAAARWWQSASPPARSYELQQREISRIDAQYQRLAADAEEYRPRRPRAWTPVQDGRRPRSAVDRSETPLLGGHRLHPTVGRRAVGHRTRPPHPEVPEELRDYL